MTSQFLLKTPALSSGEPVPNHVNVLADDPVPPEDSPADYLWQDKVWMRRRAEEQSASSPMAIYRLFPAAWRLDEQGQPLKWRLLATQLVPYVADLGFTHVELKDVRKGEINQEFAQFVDHCHEGGVGVILEWPPAGSEPGHDSEDPLEQLARYVSSFHLDGLRLTANWSAGLAGTAPSAEALQALLNTVSSRFPGVLLLSDPGPRAMGADERTAQHALAWNSTWSSNTLAYLSEPPDARHAHHEMLVSGLNHAFDEHYVLPLADDESGEGRNTWLGRMPGDEWQRFANLRAGLGFMWAHPGKKLLGMGTEFAQGRGWRQAGTLDWDLFANPYHMGVFRLVADLNRIYVTEPALHIRDRSPDSFAWVVGDDSRNSVIAFLRYGDEGMAPVLAIVNFTPTVLEEYRLGVPALGIWREILNSDSEFYGGSNVGNASGARAEQIRSHGFPASLCLTIPPLATLLLRQGDWPS